MPIMPETEEVVPREREKMDSKSELRRKKLQWQAEAEEWRAIANELAEALKHAGECRPFGEWGIDACEEAKNALAKYRKMREGENVSET